MPIIDRPLEFPDAQDRASDGPVEVLDPLGLDDPVQVLIEDGPLTDRPAEGLLELLEQAFFLFRPLVQPFRDMVQRHEILEVEADVDVLRVLPVGHPVGRLIEPCQQIQEVPDHDLFVGLELAREPDLHERPAVVRVVGEIVGVRDLQQTADGVPFGVAVLPLLWDDELLGCETGLVQRHEGVEEGPALLVERRGCQAADAQCQPGERHPGVAIRTDDEIEAAPGPHVEEGHDALLRQAVLGGTRHVAPQMDQAADVDVLLAEQRRPAGLRLRLDPGLELDQFPFHDVREGAGTSSDLPELVLVLGTHALPEVGCLGSRLYFVHDERGQGVRRGRRGGVQEALYGGAEMPEGSIATGHTRNYKAAAPTTEASSAFNPSGMLPSATASLMASRRPRDWNRTGGTGWPAR